MEDNKIITDSASLAVVNVKSTFISNADTLPNPIITDRAISRGAVYTVCGFVPIATTDSIGSVYRLARMPASARIISIKAFNTAIATGVYNCGFYFTQTPQGANGPVVNSGTEIATGLSESSGNIQGFELRYFSQPLSSIETYVWGLLGYTIDDGNFYDLCLTTTTAATTAGTVAFEVLWAAS